MSDFSRMMELAMAANKAATQEALGVPKAPEEDAAKKPASASAREEHPAQRETSRRG